MKKLYSFFAAVVMAVAVNAQGAETFETQTDLTRSYANGSFAGETTGVTVNYVHSRNEGLDTTDDSSIDGKGIMLRRADEPSSVEFVIPNGVGEFTFEYRKAFTGGTERVLAVFVDDVDVYHTPGFGSGSGAQTTVYSATVPVNKSGAVKVKISYPAGTATGNRQATIDNVSWTAATLSVTDIDGAQKKFIKNTLVDNTIEFSAKANVKIYNVNGQMVKEAAVNNGTRLDVSNLAKGMYIVAGEVDGQAATAKVIKK